jgi:hypothetical protein
MNFFHRVALAASGVALVTAVAVAGSSGRGGDFRIPDAGPAVVAASGSMTTTAGAPVRAQDGIRWEGPHRGGIRWE